MEYFIYIQYIIFIFLSSLFFFLFFFYFSFLIFCSIAAVAKQDLFASVDRRSMLANCSSLTTRTLAPTLAHTLAYFLKKISGVTVVGK